MQPQIPESSRRYRSYWVRSYDPNTLIYTLTQVGGKDAGKPLYVKVDPAGDKNRVTTALNAALDRSAGGAEPVRLVLRRTTKENRPAKGGKGDEMQGDTDQAVSPPVTEIVVHHVVPSDLTADKDSRKIFDDKNELVSVWTSELDKSVFRHSELAHFHAAMEHQKKLATDQAYFDSVRELAAKIMEQELAQRDPPITVPPENLQRYLHSTFTAVARGTETSGEGEARCRRYDATASFGEQTDCADFHGAPHISTEGMTQLGNYAMQRAVVESLAHACVNAAAKDGRTASLAETSQDDLLTANVLIAGHPRKAADDFREESLEMARIQGAAALASLQGYCGALPMRPEFDPLVRPNPLGGAPILRYPVCREIAVEAKQLTPENLDDLGKIQGFLNIGSHRAIRYKDDMAMKVFKIQSVVVPKNGKKPKPPSERPPPKPAVTPADIVAEGKRGLGNAATGLESAINDTAEITFPGL